MNILVTGGCGFIGSNFINYYINKYNCKIINVDKLDYCSSKDNVKNHENYTFICGDVNDIKFVLNVLNKYNIDTVIHFASQTHVDNSFEEWKSLQFTRDNVLGTHSLLECCRLYKKLKLFLHMSTDEVYGEVSIDNPGCTDVSILNPTNPYAATKAGAEMMVRSYYHSFKIPIIIMRCNNAYGPNQYPEKLIPKFTKQLSEDKKCTIHGDGKHRRNFIHTYDISTAIDIIISSGTIGKMYNIGTQDEYSVIEVANMLINHFKNDTIDKWIEYGNDRYYNDFRYAIDNSELVKLGWKQTINLRDYINTL